MNIRSAAAGCCLLVGALQGRAQTVLVGDSAYLGLRPRHDSLGSVVAQLGGHYRKEDLRFWFHVRYRDGGDGHGTRLGGYALHYRRLGAIFCVDEKTGELFWIQLTRRATVVSVRGIRPGAATFAQVLARYGPSEWATLREGQPGVYEFSFDRKTYYTSLRYPHIWFVSRGKPQAGENLLTRPVQEIWLH